MALRRLARFNLNLGVRVQNVVGCQRLCRVVAIRRQPLGCRLPLQTQWVTGLFNRLEFLHVIRHPAFLGLADLLLTRSNAPLNSPVEAENAKLTKFLIDLCEPLAFSLSAVPIHNIFRNTACGGHRAIHGSVLADSTMRPTCKWSRGFQTTNETAVCSGGEMGVRRMPVVHAAGVATAVENLIPHRSITPTRCSQWKRVGKKVLAKARAYFDADQYVNLALNLHAIPVHHRASLLLPKRRAIDGSDRRTSEVLHGGRGVSRAKRTVVPPLPPLTCSPVFSLCL
jgi:hypothetical protein